MTVLLLVIAGFLIAGYFYAKLPSFDSDGGLGLFLGGVVAVVVTAVLASFSVPRVPEPVDPWKLECIKKGGAPQTKFTKVEGYSPVYFETCVYENPIPTTR